MGKAVALTGRPARAEREGGREGARAGMGQVGRKAEGTGKAGFFSFFFYAFKVGLNYHSD